MTPTDDDLAVLIVKHNVMTQWPTQKQCNDFARAVLAKWGTPPAGEPVAEVVRSTAIDAQFAPRAVWPLSNFHELPLGTKLYTAPPVRDPLDVIELMRVVMKADEETRGFALRGTTNWAAHIGKAVQNAAIGIKGEPHADT